MQDPSSSEPDSISAPPYAMDASASTDSAPAKLDRQSKSRLSNLIRSKSRNADIKDREGALLEPPGSDSPLEPTPSSPPIKSPKSPNPNRFSSGLDIRSRTKESLGDIKRLMAPRSRKAAADSDHSDGEGPASAGPHVTKTSKYVLWVTIFKAKELPTWPQNFLPRVYAAISVNKVRTVTARWGGHVKYYDHSTPVWDETLRVPVEMGPEDFVKVRLQTVINMTRDNRHDVAMAKARIPVSAIPVCDELPTEETLTELYSENAQVVTTEEDANDDFGFSRIEKPSNRPLKVWIKMQKTDRARFPVVAGMVSTVGKSRGWLQLAICLVPADKAAVDEGYYTEDEGDSEGAEEINWPDPLPNVLYDDTVPCSVHKLNRLLFGTNSRFTQLVYQERGYSNIEIGEWEDRDGRLCRTIRYNLPPGGMGGGGPANEEHCMLVNDPGGKVVLVQVSTPKVPYGETFHNELQHATTRIDDKSCGYRLSHNTVFSKDIMMKGTIRNASEKGVRASMAQTLSLLDGFLRRGATRKQIALSDNTQSQESAISQVKQQMNKLVEWCQNWLREGTVPAPVFMCLCILTALSLILNMVTLSGTTTRTYLSIDD